MGMFDKKSSLILLLFTIPLIFLPKINLVGFEDESAGIRIDDLILFVFSGIIFWAVFQTERNFSLFENGILMITSFSLISFLSNKILAFSHVIDVDAKIFYCIRLFEYFFFFYIGVLYARLFSLDRLLLVFFLWNAFLMVLQKVNLIGGILNGNYVDDVSNRVLGIAAFASEMGYILNLLFAYFAFSDSLKESFTRLFPYRIQPLMKVLYLYVIFFLFAFLTVLTGNRISVLALGICFLAKAWIEWRKQSPQIRVTIFLCFMALLLGMVKITLSSDDLMARSSNLLSFKNFNAVSDVWAKIDLSRNPIGQENDDLVGINYDESWWMRAHKWIYVLKKFIETPQSYLQGLGPGVAFIALDGGILRILVEYGLIGSVMFFYFFSLIYRQSQQLQWMIIVFLINMITFDVYLAYKPMSLIFLISGYTYAVSKTSKISQNSEHIQASFT